MIVAVCGKGGVGKTTVAAVMARGLVKSDKNALMVDADPAGGLSMALGIEPKKTLNDVRKELIEEVKAGHRNPGDLAVSVDYLLAETLIEKENLALLSIGRPEDEGCYCKVNIILKDAIEGMAGQFDITIIDAEAGIEQVNRKVTGFVDYLLLVSDTSAKGLRVAETIKDVAGTMGGWGRAGLMVNRVKPDTNQSSLASQTALDIIGTVPEDETIRRYDEENISFFDLPDCPGSKAIEGALKKVGIL